MSDKSTCPCGGVILVDTEDWETPLCYSCYSDLLEINQTAKSRIADLEAKLEAANRKVEKLVIENRELDYKMCPGCGMETMKGAYTEKLESLHAENTKLKALLGEAVRALKDGCYCRPGGSTCYCCKGLSKLQEVRE